MSGEAVLGRLFEVLFCSKEDVKLWSVIWLYIPVAYGVMLIRPFGQLASGGPGPRFPVLGASRDNRAIVFVLCVWW